VTGAVAGVDGGATRTRVVFLATDGTELARAEGPPGLVDPRWPERAGEVVAALVRDAARDAGVPLPLDALWAGLAGAGRGEPRDGARSALAASGVARVLVVGTDVEAAFGHAFPEGAGILLVSGTGSVALGRSRDGREVRVGGWGALLGDEGSGYSVGLEALRRLVRARDGREEPSSLTARVLEALSLREEEELIAWASSATKSQVAALVPVVGAAAAAGEGAAGRILDEAARALLRHVLAARDRTGPWASGAPAVALAGGLLEAGGTLRERVAALIREEGLPLRADPVDGALGAARLAGGLTR